MARLARKHQDVVVGVKSAHYFAPDWGSVDAAIEAGEAAGGRFDVGHGGGSFVFRDAVHAVAQGFYPDSISTDLHTGSMNSAMMDMPTTMSKFLAMGMPLKDVILASTWTPARIIAREQLGHLTARADVAVWRVMDGEFAFSDASRGDSAEPSGCSAK